MDDVKNPYRPDMPGAGPFVGRSDALDLLENAIRSGRRGLAAVMGGRGMGKTSVALELAKRLGEAPENVVRLIRRPSGDPRMFLAQMEKALGLPLDPLLPVESLIEAIESLDCSRCVLLIDEVENSLHPGAFRDLLENLRAAYEHLGGKLGIVIFGGSSLRELLTSKSSPFLRTARWVPLIGLSLADSARLIREPLGLKVPDPLVEAIWEQTSGHPLVLQTLMEHAVALGGDPVTQIPEAMRAIGEELSAAVFPIWWDNLMPAGQSAYRTLVGLRHPLHRRDWARMLGNGPDAVVEILATTGVARTGGEYVVPRGSLFHGWFVRNHPGQDAVPPTVAPDTTGPLDALAVHPFERSLVEGIAIWARAALEYPTHHLREEQAPGNAGLPVEKHFQIDLLVSLLQRQPVVEAESLSGARGRSDIKVRWQPDPARRACIEVKIWNRTGYKDVVEQVLGYVVPGDDFACVVMVDRQRGPLADRYHRECLRGGTFGEGIWPGDSASGVTYPAFITRHTLASGGEVRVHHFLVQLPPDAAA